MRGPMYRLLTMFILIVSFAVVLAACTTREVATGAAVGGAAYEYSNKRAMDELKSDRDAGRISRAEYERRKREIEKRSLVY